MASIINSLERTTTVANVVDQIRAKIILQQYRNNSFLTEISLAREYGTSRGSVRTALQALENEGIIVTLPNGRKQVMGLTEKYIQDLYNTRKLIEHEAARQILDLTRVDFTEMAAMVSRFRELVGAPAEIMRRERTSVNMQFHRALVRMCQNRPLLQCWNTIDTMLEALIRFNADTNAPESHTDKYVVTHSRILEMFLAGDRGVLDYLDFHTFEAPYQETLDGLRAKGCL